METVIIILVAAIASLLTFFSGFGLGTILTPFFVLFFPAEVAIALTGIVHLLNNLFKITLVGKHINWNAGLKFGITGIIGAFLGASLLFYISGGSDLYTYHIKGMAHHITLLKLIIAGMMLVFSLFEILPALTDIQLDRNKIYPGGFISGFFGGLSGHQGALRTMFLIRFGLSKESFIATGIFVACMVDITRLSVYFSRLDKFDVVEHLGILIPAILAAFTGAYAGSKLLKKVTLGFVKWTVAVMIFLLSVALGTGLL